MKICLAGTSAATKNTRKYLNYTKYILESFWYIQDWQLEYLNKKDLFLLDSGAFTFMNNFKGKVDWKEYIDKYADFIIKNKVKNFFELDIDVIVGYEKVKEYTKYLEQKTGRKCIPVWHVKRGLDEWTRLTKEYDYVAIGGIVAKEIKSSQYDMFIPLLKIAKENNCKVHGLGFTNLKLMKKYHFYSVDSTSWKSGGRFGIIYEFKNNKMYQYKKPDNKRAKSANGWHDKIELQNMLAWSKLQEYADKYY
jgi:hypothetical protein